MKRGDALLVAGVTATLWACGNGLPSLDQGSNNDEELVYGKDDRQDVYSHPNARLQQLAKQSSVAILDQDSVDLSNPSKATFDVASLGEAEGLCKDQRFRSDPTAAYCSGTLIDDDLVLTAGHCITSRADCARARLVFKYYRASARRLETVTEEDVFSCTSIVVRLENDDGPDYEVIRLDRPATPRFSPAPVRFAASPLPLGAALASIGCPSGIPVKIDAGGKVREPRGNHLDYFVASTDTFSGSSGSGIFDLATYSLAGILVRGDDDYVPRGNCAVVNTCGDNECLGESATYVRQAIKALCAKSQSARLCSAL
jgi:V8-like Glu-specific endopeptidase